MADSDTFLRGASIGLTVAIPVGPMAILCVRHTLTSGAATGLFFGAGIAAADTTYAAIAAIGIVAVTSLLDAYQDAIRVAGGLVMVVLGLSILSAGYVPRIGRRRLSLRIPAPAGFVLAFGLTMANPMTVMIFAGLLAGYGLAFTGSSRSTAILLAGVFAGSMTWWILVILLTASIRVKTTELWLKRLNLIAGAGITVFGLLAMLSALG